MNYEFDYFNRLYTVEENDEAILQTIPKLKKGDKISIKNVPTSHIYYDLLDFEFDDFNGWQGDWWASTIYNEIKLFLTGTLFTGEITITLNEEE